jgi:enoyl-CoA hydratase
VAVRYCLEAVQRGAELPLAEGGAFESNLFGLIFSSEDMREGTRAFVEKREPSFRGK